MVSPESRPLPRLLCRAGAEIGEHAHHAADRIARQPPAAASLVIIAVIMSPAVLAAHRAFIRPP
jgi:hypothetical protein